MEKQLQTSLHLPPRAHSTCRSLENILWFTEGPWKIMMQRYDLIDCPMEMKILRLKKKTVIGE